MKFSLIIGKYETPNLDKQEPKRSETANYTK